MRTMEVVVMEPKVELLFAFERVLIGAGAVPILGERSG